MAVGTYHWPGEDPIYYEYETDEEVRKKREEEKRESVDLPSGYLLTASYISLLLFI